MPCAAPYLPQLINLSRIRGTDIYDREMQLMHLWAAGDLTKPLHLYLLPYSTERKFLEGSEAIRNGWRNASRLLPRPSELARVPL